MALGGRKEKGKRRVGRAARQAKIDYAVMTALGFEYMTLVKLKHEQFEIMFKDDGLGN